jgi:nucleotide-binding universal stress UspA family protein
VWEAGAAYADVTDATELPVIDIRTAPDLDAAMYDAARLTAQEGAEHARRVNIDAEALAVADEATVAETLVRVASERDARAIVVGSHGHRALRERLFGTTTQSVIKDAPCPVVVVRDQEK